MLRNFLKIASWPLVLLSIPFLLCSCQKKQSSTISANNINKFPSRMVGTWEAPRQSLISPNWQIKFEKDGTISKIYHRIFGEIIISNGGFYNDGPDPGTYIFVTLGPVETQYDPCSKVIKVRIVVEDYEMKMPQGILEGRMIDTLIGKASDDGKTWKAEWRNYGWIKGAQEPDTSYIDQNPDEIIVFQKVDSSDANVPNGKTQ